jgi:Dynamin family
MHAIHETFLRGLPAIASFAGQLDGVAADLTQAGRGVARVERIVRALRCAAAILRRPLRLAILGEGNSGKSTLANLLLGNAVIPTFQLPNTRIPTLLRFAASPSIGAMMAGGVTLPLSGGGPIQGEMIGIEVGVPIDHLKAFEILDFPGFADPWLGYGSMDVARHRIDASIWCTFSTQAWKESERAAWQALPRRMRGHAMLAVTNGDLLRKEQSHKVLARLAKVAAGDFGATVLVASLNAQRALREDGGVADAGRWQASGGAGLLDAVGDMLERLRQEKLKRAQAFATAVAGKALDHLDALENH